MVFVSYMDHPQLHKKNFFPFSTLKRRHKSRKFQKITGGLPLWSIW